MTFFVFAIIIKESSLQYIPLENSKNCYKIYNNNNNIDKYVALNFYSIDTVPPELLAIETDAQILYTQNKEQNVYSRYAYDYYKLTNIKCPSTLELSFGDLTSGVLNYHIIIYLGYGQIMLSEISGSFEYNTKSEIFNVISYDNVLNLFININKNNNEVLYKSNKIYNKNEFVNLPVTNIVFDDCIGIIDHYKAFSLKIEKIQIMNKLTPAIQLCVYDSKSIYYCQSYPVLKMKCPIDNSKNIENIIISETSEDKKVALIPIKFGENPIAETKNSNFHDTNNEFYTLKDISISAKKDLNNNDKKINLYLHQKLILYQRLSGNLLIIKRVDPKGVYLPPRLIETEVNIGTQGNYIKLSEIN